MKLKLSTYGLLVFLVLSSCMTVAPAEKAPKGIIGQWTEYWTDPNGVQLTYNDIYDIRMEKGGIAVRCLQRDYYSFENVAYENGLFKFRLINAHDEEDPFIIDYVLAMNRDENELNGKASTNKGIVATIRMVKTK